METFHNDRIQEEERKKELESMHQLNSIIHLMSHNFYGNKQKMLID